MCVCLSVCSCCGKTKFEFVFICINETFIISIDRSTEQINPYFILQIRRSETGGLTSKVLGTLDNVLDSKVGNFWYFLKIPGTAKKTRTNEKLIYHLISHQLGSRRQQWSFIPYPANSWFWQEFFQNFLYKLCLNYMSRCFLLVQRYSLVKNSWHKGGVVDMTYWAIDLVPK